MSMCIHLHLIPYKLFLDEEEEEDVDDYIDEDEQETSGAPEETSVPNRNNARIDYDGWVGIDSTDSELDDIHEQPSN